MCVGPDRYSIDTQPEGRGSPSNHHHHLLLLLLKKDGAPDASFLIADHGPRESSFSFVGNERGVSSRGNPTTIRSRPIAPHPDQPLDLLARMEASGMHPSTASYAHLITALGAVGRTLEADAVFQEMKWVGLRSGLGDYNGPLRAFLRKGQLRLAEYLLVEMGEKGFGWNRDTCMLLLDSYVCTGHPDDT